MKKIEFKERNLWLMSFLMIITFTLYSVYWFFKTNKELSKFDKKAPWAWLYLIIYGLSMIGSSILMVLSMIFFESKGITSVLTVILEILFWGFISLYFYKYFKSMEKITKRISKWGALFIYIILTLILYLIINIVIEFSYYDYGLGLVVLLFSIILFWVISTFYPVYLQSIYNKFPPIK